MTWAAIVPLKPLGERKSRLASRLDTVARAQLSEVLLHHVLATLAQSVSIQTVILLSDVRPPEWTGCWIEDRGSGLNAELQAARARLGALPLLVIHADLPLIAAADVEAMIAAAGVAGCAIGPDRHGIGTNALALVDGRDFQFRFGPGSFAKHVAEANPRHIVVERPGLALDCDTPDDLAIASARGFVFRPS